MIAYNQGHYIFSYFRPIWFCISNQFQKLVTHLAAWIMVRVAKSTVPRPSLITKLTADSMNSDSSINPNNRALSYSQYNGKWIGDISAGGWGYTHGPARTKQGFAMYDRGNNPIDPTMTEASSHKISPIIFSARMISNCAGLSTNCTFCLVDV